MATYNGHKNYDYWNVSLWIGNDEGIYRLAVYYVRKLGKAKAVQALLADLPPKTPDGVTYTAANVRAALSGIER